MLRPPRPDYQAISHAVLRRFVASLWSRTVSGVEFFLALGETILNLEPEVVSQASVRRGEQTGLASQESTVRGETGLDLELLRARQERFRQLKQNALEDGVPEVYVAAVLSYFTGHSPDEIAELLELPPARIKLDLAEASADLHLKLV
jgi:DNA-directed RNA polymerase specialized sigma24 family protein